MSGKGKKQEEEQRSPSPPRSLQQPSSSRVQRSPPQATSSGEGRKKGNSNGGAASKPEGAGCSLCCVVLLSAAVAVAAVAGYAAFVAFPTESEQLLREVDSHVRRIVGKLDDFVKTKLDRILNRGPQSAKENSPEAQESSDVEHTDHEQHEDGSLEEEREEYDPHGRHGSASVEEFDHVEPEGKAGNIEDILDDAGIDFEPETLVIEKEDLGGEIFDEGVREAVDEDAEFEGKTDEEELEEEDNGEEEELEDPQNDPSHRWETVEVLDGATEDDTGVQQFEKPVSEDGLEMERHVAPEIEEEVSEHEGTEEPRVTPHQALHQEPQKVFADSLATETAESIEDASADTLLNVTPEGTTEEVDTQETPQPEQKVPVQGTPDDVISNQEVFEEEAGSHEAPAQEDIPSGDDAEVVIPGEELLQSQEISSEE